MGILDAYQDSTDTALRVMATQPLTPEPVTPKHSTWSAPFRAVAAGAAEVAGNVMDTAGAFGQVSAAAGGLTPGFDPDAAKNRNATVDAYDKLKTEGINWRTDEAQQAYKFGADLRPDPLTAGTAENLVFSLTKGLTKAIGAAVALGPVGGAAAFGASEGMTTAEDLANQGVDQATRTKVGAVTAGFNAAGVAIPVAGKTLAQTAGLVLAGGPASFMAQQAATREILRNADYKTIAEQYDPLDPVGLTVATLLPAGFAAYAKRGGFGAKPKPDVAPVAEAAQDSNVIAATPEAVDAAMVQNLTVARDVHESSAVSISENGSGWIEAKSGFGTVGGTVRDGVLRITNADVIESERGKGYGVALYQSLIDEAHRRGLAVTSDVTVEGPAARVYDALARRGYQVEKAPGGGIIEPDSMAPTGGLYGPGGDSPVFSVGPKNKQTSEYSQQTSEYSDAYAARVDAIAKEQPDLIARLDEAGQPVKLSDELAAIKKQAQEGTDTDFGALDAPLLKTALECALSLGAA